MSRGTRFPPPKSHGRLSTRTPAVQGRASAVDTGTGVLSLPASTNPPSEARRPVPWIVSVSSLYSPTHPRRTDVRQAIMYAPGDVRVEQRDKPTIVHPTDAVIRVSAACVCGSDLWPYRGIQAVTRPTPMGHEYVGVVEEVGSDVRAITPGQFVAGSFMASDNSCEICQAGYQSRCVHVEPVGAG